MEKHTPTTYIHAQGEQRTDNNTQYTPATATFNTTPAGLSAIRRGVDPFATTITSSDRSWDNTESKQFPQGQNYNQRTYSTNVEKRTTQSEKEGQVSQFVVVSPPLTAPPPYTPSCPSNSSDLLSPEFGDFVTAPFPGIAQPQRQYHTTTTPVAAPSVTTPTTNTTTSTYQLQPSNWRDSSVPSVKLADDPGSSNPRGDDRRHERSPGDHPHHYTPSHLPPGPPISAPPAPYQTPYWAQPSHQPPGIGPYDRPKSPPTRYPFAPPPIYPSPFHPPPSFPAPPSPYGTSSAYPPQPNPYVYLGPVGGPLLSGRHPDPSILPPRLPAIPSYSGIRPPPDKPGVLPPAPFFGPPKSPKLILPPGTPTDFKLVVRQQPERARMCGFGEKDRRPIDPPPIVELIELNGPITATQRQGLVLQCTLWNEDGTEHRNIIRTTTGATAGLGSAEELPVQPEEKHARVMMGNIFANATHLEDDQGKKGYFYIFPDLSIRVEGRYRLKFDLLRLVLPPGPPLLGASQVAAECLSDIFVVFAAKKFPGMMQSTPLTKAIARQGIKISVRTEPRGRREGKGNTKRTGKRRAGNTSDVDDDDEEVSSIVSSENKRKRSTD